MLDAPSTADVKGVRMHSVARMVRLSKSFYLYLYLQSCFGLIIHWTLLVVLGFRVCNHGN